MAHLCTKFHCERSHHKHVIGTNTVYLPEAVSWWISVPRFIVRGTNTSFIALLLFTNLCNFCFDQLLSWYISVQSVIVRGHTTSKHTHYLQVFIA